MTTPLSTADIQLEFYERFFIDQGLEPYPAQERAMDHIFAGDSTLVTVPTGTGKTLCAKAGIYKALRLGQRAIYTTPLRALTEEKFRELCEDFGEQQVGFATGDYRVRPEAPVQVLVAEILWNRIYGQRSRVPADLVILDEGHYFNDPERGYVWEQSVIGLDARIQLVILSATIGEAERFCQWVYLCRRVPMELVQSFDRQVPLHHEFRETYFLDLCKDLFAQGECPAIIFGFSREQCFERARLLRSCRRFTSDEERLEIAEACHGVLLERGLGRDLEPMLLHGIGIHHAGILPRYKQLVEKLTLARLLKFVVSTETISAGINLPAKRVVFPELRKFVQGKARLLTSAEYHQMSGRAGRPQFDSEGIAITLAPEEVVREIREQERAAQKGHYSLDPVRLRKAAYSRARSDAQRAGDISWDAEAHQRLVRGQPAPLRSQTRISAEQVLAIGLPDLAREQLPGAHLLAAEVTQAADATQAAEAAAGPAAAGAANPSDAVAASQDEAPQAPPRVALLAGPAPAGDDGLPASLHLNIVTVIDNLLLDDSKKTAAHKRLAQVTANLRALGVVDEHGAQVQGEVVGKLRGIDGLFVYFCLLARDLCYEEWRELCELLLDHDVVHRILTRKQTEARREWIRGRLRERRREEPQLTWEDVEAEYEERFPRQLGPIEVLHNEFLGRLPHPELHGGKQAKSVFAAIEDQELSFMDFVEQHNLVMEEGSLFTYLARVGKIARMLREATGIVELGRIEDTVRSRLSAVDDRVLEQMG